MICLLEYFCKTLYALVHYYEQSASDIFFKHKLFLLPADEIQSAMNVIGMMTDVNQLADRETVLCCLLCNFQEREKMTLSEYARTIRVLLILHTYTTK